MDDLRKLAEAHLHSNIGVRARRILAMLNALTLAKAALANSSPTVFIDTAKAHLRDDALAALEALEAME